jgi:hypothetical protein
MSGLEVATLLAAGFSLAIVKELLTTGVHG